MGTTTFVELTLEVCLDGLLGYVVHWDEEVSEEESATTFPWCSGMGLAGERLLS